VWRGALSPQLFLSVHHPSHVAGVPRSISGPRAGPDVTVRRGARAAASASCQLAASASASAFGRASGPRGRSVRVGLSVPTTSHNIIFIITPNPTPMGQASAKLQVLTAASQALGQCG
jgi:hypothetical protein